MSHTYEIEIKSLLGSKDNADRLKEKLMASDPEISLVGRSSQLNHYFNAPDDLSALRESLAPYFPPEKKESFEKIIEEGKNVSIRTRKTDTAVIFIIKASVGGDTSANGVSRIEFESVVPKTIEELDQILIDSGCSYQAKWSRDREEYRSKNATVTIDRNAGYGYLAEFERVTDSPENIETIKQELKNFMESVGALELPQDRLERMFAHYNKNWRDYYGTDKVFIIE